MIYNNDCLKIMKDMQDKTVDLIYLDPPFFSQKNQKLTNTEGRLYKFSDVWESQDQYLNYMKERLLEMKRILKSTGNIFLHCDTSASHYLKILLDDIFGKNNFRSEIIWIYKRWSNSQKALMPAHQTIFYYSKSKNYKFNTIYCDYAPTTNVDQILQERERNKNGKVSYKKNEQGETILAKEKKGVPMSDVWEIPFLNPKAKERTGYPTQKPIELLERIIKIASDEGDVVLDPFCGSGTTLVSANLLKRKYIGIDINPEAVELTKLRLDKPFKTTSTLLQVGEDRYKTKTNKELDILKQIDCNIVQRNKGIDAFLKKAYLNAPVALKIQKDDEDILEAVQLLDAAGKTKKCSFTILLTKCNNLTNISIPSNMILINQYNTLIDSLICNRI